MPDSILVKRAQLYSSIRRFFEDRGVLEVSLPLLAPHTVTDPHIRSLQVETGRGIGYLQTSPEYAMKKLLAADSGPIYNLGSVFRAGEEGTRHRTEFTMLEWYRPSLSLSELQMELTELIQVLAERFDVSFPQPNCVSYRSLFEERFELNPHEADDSELEALVHQFFPDLAGHLQHQDAGARNDYLDLLFSQGVEPSLQQPHFVIEFPASQAALAQVRQSAQYDEVALRSELYWQGVELSNAYVELRDASVLKKRAGVDNAIRETRGLSFIQPDVELFAAIEKMPACVGVAMGIDRLLMLLLGENDIAKVCYKV